MNLCPHAPLPGTAAAPASALARADFARGVNRILVLCSLTLLLAGCNSETLFQSGFNSNAIGAPPAHNQATGTVTVEGDPGSVVVVAPLPGAGSDRWAQIHRQSKFESAVPTMHGNLSQIRGPGTYGMLAVLYIPSGSGLVSLDFDAVGVTPNPVSLLHLDFVSGTPNLVRINDDPARTFGSFPNDHAFTVSVGLDTTGPSPVAHVAFLRAGTSGNADIPLQPVGFVSQFGAVRFWMGFPWTGTFDVTDILVTHNL